MTDELPPHLVGFGKYRPKPPRPMMETVQRGSASLRQVPKDYEPLRPVASDNETRWVSLAQAAASIAAAIPDRAEAEGAIMDAALSGLVGLSCEALEVQTADGDALFTVKRPGVDANLARRIDKARKSGVMGYVYLSARSSLSWLNPVSRQRVNLLRLLVDAEGVSAFFADPAIRAPQLEPKPALKERAPTGSAAAGETPVVTAGTRGIMGRPRGTEIYSGDADIVRRVIDLCDNGAFTEPARVRHAIKSLIEDIEPRGQGADADAGKIRRIRDKVLRVRDDLT